MSNKSKGALLSSAEPESQNGASHPHHSPPDVLPCLWALQPFDWGGLGWNRLQYIRMWFQLYADRMSSEKAYDAWLNHDMKWGHL